MTNRTRIPTGVMAGFMELSPAQQRVFDSVINTIRGAYEGAGFIGIETPILEREEVLLAKAGGDTEKQIYRFEKGDTKIAMRFDHTVPLARYVAEHRQDITFPFRRYAIGKVYRGERPQKGRFREFYQADIDVIGLGSLPISFDAEIPSVIFQVFSKLDIGPFVISVNNRKILNGFFAYLGLQDKIADILREIDKLEKVGLDSVRDALGALGLDADSVTQVLEFISIAGTTEEVFSRLDELGIEGEEFQQGLEELNQVVSLMGSFGVPNSSFKVDLTIARGLDYYTGTVYETKLVNHPEVGSICSGGRYDNLSDSFSNESMPGVGISIGVTRMFSQLWELGLLKPLPTSPSVVLVVPIDIELGQAAGLVYKLRELKVPTEMYSADGKLGKALKYANNLNIPFVLMIGQDELDSGKITLKRMSDGEQMEFESVEASLKAIEV